MTIHYKIVALEPEHGDVVSPDEIVAVILSLLQGKNTWDEINVSNLESYVTLLRQDMPAMAMKWIRRFFEDCPTASRDQRLESIINGLKTDEMAKWAGLIADHYQSDDDMLDITKAVEIYIDWAECTPIRDRMYNSMLNAVLRLNYVNHGEEVSRRALAGAESKGQAHINEVYAQSNLETVRFWDNHIPWVELGRLVFTGFVGKQDTDMATRFFQKAYRSETVKIRNFRFVKEGDAHVLVLIGIAGELKVPVFNTSDNPPERDYDLAIRFRQCKQAKFYLGSRLYDSSNPDDRPKGLKYMVDACRNGFEPAHIAMIRVASQIGFAELARYFPENDPFLYYLNARQQTDPTLALQSYEHAFGHGFVPASLDLAIAYRYGLGTDVKKEYYRCYMTVAKRTGVLSLYQSLSDLSEDTYINDRLAFIRNQNFDSMSFDRLRGRLQGLMESQCSESPVEKVRVKKTSGAQGKKRVKSRTSKASKTKPKHPTTPFLHRVESRAVAPVAAAKAPRLDHGFASLLQAATMVESQHPMDQAPAISGSCRHFYIPEDINDAYQMGLAAYQSNDYKKAVLLFKYAKNRGHVEATFKLAECYRNGHGLTQNLDAAERLYQEGQMRRLGIG